LGIPWTDPFFPPNEESLFNIDRTRLGQDIKDKWKKLVWMRASDLLGNDVEVFHKGIEIEDIR